MSSNERRERLLQILKKSDEPVKGSELSAELQVSRQVVVKDIALLRASGIEILATSSGYIILNPCSCSGCHCAADIRSILLPCVW